MVGGMHHVRARTHRWHPSNIPVLPHALRALHAMLASREAVDVT